MSYRYPDPDDAIAQAAIVHDDRQAASMSAEAELHRVIRELLIKRLGCRLRILDLGAGPGRLVREYIGLARFFAAVDRDPARIGRAAITAAARAAGTRVDIRDSRDRPLAQLYGTPFDFIIVSHVLQHLASAAADDLMNQAVEKLRPGGWIYLAVSVSQRAADEYAMLWSECGKPCSRALDESAFAAACEHPQDGYLPGRLFSYAGLTSLCRRHGLAIRRAFGYRYTNDYRGERERPLPITREIPPGVCDLALLLERVRG